MEELIYPIQSKENATLKMCYGENKIRAYRLYSNEGYQLVIGNNVEHNGIVCIQVSPERLSELDIYNTVLME
jgi:hypothetical protein